MRPIELLLKKGDDILAGQGEPFEDWRDALEIYQKAALLDSGKAFYKIGLIYEKQRSKSSREKAITNYKQALRLSYIPAAAALALIYQIDSEGERSERMWKYFFSNVNINDNSSEITMAYALEYIDYCMSNNIKVKELAFFNLYLKEFEDFINSVYNSDVLYRAREISNDIDRLNSELNEDISAMLNILAEPPSSIADSEGGKGITDFTGMILDKQNHLSSLKNSLKDIDKRSKHMENLIKYLNKFIKSNPLS